MSRYDSSKDYYSILGAEESASQSEIERLYKRRAQQHHPDRGGDEEEMKSLNEAYRVLKDESARRDYDAERHRSADVSTEETDARPYTSPPAHVDVFTGQWVGAILFIGLGLVLALLVRFQWMFFLWPLAILAFFLICVGVLMAHGAMRRIGEERSVSRKWLSPTLEVAFWIAVLGGGYGIYLIIS
ncbi:MAG TPA: J domain-containing protein [Pyrinomonadaceae bacterium]|nr:J domain-containing protein [Pyrinomonadaceae bacterium]